MTFTESFDQTCFALSLVGLAFVIGSQHLDVCFYSKNQYLPVRDEDLDDDVVTGDGAPFLNTPSLLEMIFFWIGWGVLTGAVYRSVDVVDAADSSRSRNSLLAWGITGVLAVPFFATVPACMGGFTHSHRCVIPKTINTVLFTGSWLILSMFVAHEKPSPYSVYGVISGPLICTSSLIIVMTRYREGWGKWIIRWLSTAFFATGWVLFLLAISHRPE